MNRTIQSPDTYPVPGDVFVVQWYTGNINTVDELPPPTGLKSVEGGGFLLPHTRLPWNQKVPQQWLYAPQAY